MKKRFWMMMLLSFFTLVLFACTGETTMSLDVNTITIEAVDAIDIPEGTYVVPYTIEDLQSYVDTYGVSVTLSAVDQDGASVNVNTNSLTVVANAVYTVTITVSTTDGYEKTKVITISAIRTTTTVFFDWNYSGAAQATTEVATINQLLTPLSNEPTRVDYSLEGWYLDAECTTKWDFATNLVTDNLVLYAHWLLQEQAETRTVTYNFNGAFQTEPLVDAFEVGSTPIENAFIPTRDDYAFGGWYTESDCIHYYHFESETLTENVTLYASWTALISDKFAVLSPEILYVNDGSEIINFTPYQMVDAYIQLFYSEAEDILDFDNIEVGVLYSTASSDLLYHNPLTHKVVNSDFVFDEYTQLVKVKSQPLDDNTTYYFKLYVKSGSDIYYSNIQEYTTVTLVPSGQNVGCTDVVSGGVYHIDNGTYIYRPHMMIGIDSGYHATLEDNYYGSYSYIYSNGYKSLVTINESTGEKYLHVFQTFIQNSPINIDYQFNGVIYTGTAFEFNVTYSAFLLEPEIYHYHIDEIGVLYSTSHIYLELGGEGVNFRSGTFDPVTSTFTTNSPIVLPTNVDTIYVRGYINADGKYYLSDEITVLTRGLPESVVLNVDRTILVDEIIVGLPDSTTFYPGTGVETKTVTFTPSYNEVFNTGTFILSEAGTYYVTYLSSPIITSYRKVVIQDFTPVVTGVEENGVYSSGVVILCDQFQAVFDLQKEDGDWVSIASGVWVSEPGFYTLHVSVPYGNITIHFEITN